MSKTATNIGIIVLSAALMIGSAVGFYNVERNRMENVSENQSYIQCAKNTLSLAGSNGIADEKPVSHATDTAGKSKMESDLTWLAEYNTDLSKLDRTYDELSTSPSINGLSGNSSYAEASSTAISYHQAQIDDINGSANVLNVVCIAVFTLGLAGATLSALRISYGKEK